MVHAHVTTHTAGIVSLRFLVFKQHKHKYGPDEILRGVGALHPPPSSVYFYTARVLRLAPLCVLPPRQLINLVNDGA